MDEHGVAGGRRRLVSTGGLQQLHMQVGPPYWEGGRLATRSSTGLVRLGRLSAQSEAVRAALTARAARRALVHRHEPCPTPTTVGCHEFRQDNAPVSRWGPAGAPWLLVIHLMRPDRKRDVIIEISGPNLTPPDRPTWRNFPLDRCRACTHSGLGAAAPPCRLPSMEVAPVVKPAVNTGVRWRQTRRWPPQTTAPSDRRRKENTVGRESLGQ